MKGAHAISTLSGLKRYLVLFVRARTRYVHVVGIHAAAPTGCGCASSRPVI